MKIVSVKLPKRETDIPQNIGESDRKAQAQVGHVLSLEEIANQLGTSKTNLKRALSIERNLTEPMKQSFQIPIFLFE